MVQTHTPHIIYDHQLDPRLSGDQGQRKHSRGHAPTYDFLDEWNPPWRRRPHRNWSTYYRRNQTCRSYGSIRESQSHRKRHNGLSFSHTLLPPQGARWPHPTLEPLNIQRFQIDAHDALADRMRVLLHGPGNQVTSLCAWSNGLKLHRYSLDTMMTFFRENPKRLKASTTASIAKSTRVFHEKHFDYQLPTTTARL